MNETLEIVFNSLPSVTEVTKDGLTSTFSDFGKLLLISFFYFLLKETSDRLELFHKRDKNIGFSINYIEDGTLKIRPIAPDTTVNALFSNNVLRRAFNKAIKESARREIALMELPLKLERDIMSVLQSYISNDFSDGFISAAAGRKVDTNKFVLMPAYEQYEDVRVRKVRIIMTNITMLEDLPGPNTVKFEKAHQNKRLVTLDYIFTRFRHFPTERQKNHTIELVLDC